MGRRRKRAPRRGSLAFRPKGRSRSPTARIRFWPKVDGPPRLLGFSGYKAGMTHAYVIETNEHSVLRGKEIFTPVTVLDTPPLFVLGARAYRYNGYGLSCITQTWTDKIPEEIRRRIRPIKPAGQKKLRDASEEIVEVRAMISTLPARSGGPRKKPEIFEVGLGGGTPQERLEHAIELLGKEVNVTSVFRPGEFVDVFSISKGKGFAGVIKRHGVKIRDRKSNKPRRGVASLGAWNPSAVMYTVPRAGQLGFWQRTERNKLVVDVGNDPEKVNARGGFIRYGLVEGSYVLLKGSVPGPAKRLVKLRISARKDVKEPKAPSVVEVAIVSPQGV